MRPLLIALVAGFPFCAGSVVCAQTYDELLAENQALQARIAVLEQSPAEGGHEHEEQHAEPATEHRAGHDHHAHGSKTNSCNPHDTCGEHEHETQFDYCNPYEGHAGGECGECGLGHSNHGHGNGSAGHGHGEGEHQHGPAYHHSVEGYPLLHGIRTEIDFVERSMEFQFGRAEGADGGQVDESEYEVELVYAISDKFVLIFGVPYIDLNPVDEPNTSGFGDLDFGFRFLAFNGERDGVFFGMNVGIPTGDEDRGLGAGNTVLEPVALWVHDFGCGTYIQSVAAWELPVDVDDPSNDFRYDIGLFHTFTETEHAEYFRYLTAIFEVNGVTTLNGADSGRTTIDLTTGVRWVCREEDEVGIGWSFPISDEENFDSLLLVSYFRHF